MRIHVECVHWLDNGRWNGIEHTHTCSHRRASNWWSIHMETGRECQGREGTWWSSRSRQQFHSRVRMNARMLVMILLLGNLVHRSLAMEQEYRFLPTRHSIYWFAIKLNVNCQSEPTNQTRNNPKRANLWLNHQYISATRQACLFSFHDCVWFVCVQITLKGQLNRSDRYTGLSTVKQGTLWTSRIIATKSKFVDTAFQVPLSKRRKEWERSSGSSVNCAPKQMVMVLDWMHAFPLITTTIAYCAPIFLVNCM